ncbi:MAG: hypothetical protein BRD49_03350 [Bacteroidetes bacterium SW_10_40_5]|nr:MAG: hypothetical protein BRD49_03350 [Bacteroidetes bacterium SW_10_40_5]
MFNIKDAKLSSIIDVLLFKGWLLLEARVLKKKLLPGQSSISIACKKAKKGPTCFGLCIYCYRLCSNFWSDHN